MSIPRSAGIALLTIVTAVAADAPPIAYFRDQPIYLEQLGGAVRKLDPAADPAGFRAAQEAAVTKYASQKLLDEELARCGISISPETARKYLQTLPAEVQAQLLPYVDQPTFQRKCAISAWLNQTLPPEKLLPDDAEIRDYYYSHLRQFRTEAENEVGIITIDKKRADAAEIAVGARARLLQGESFDRIAAEVDPGNSRPDLSAEEQEKLQAWSDSHEVGEISEVMENSQCFVLLLLKSRRPAGLRPLAEVSPFIREDLRADKEAAALTEFFLRELPPLLKMAEQP